MTLRPLYDRVVIRRLDAETTSKGGIVIPDSAAEKPSQGEVVAVGPGTLLDNGQLRALTVQAGDRVLFGKYAGSEVKLDGEELLIVQESEILAILSRKANLEKAA